MHATLAQGGGGGGVTPIDIDPVLPPTTGGLARTNGQAKIIESRSENAHAQ